jgi:hypothetical protein
LPHHELFAAGQTYTISGAEMKAYGKLSVKVTPANARITYVLHGETQEKPLQNNQERSIPPGDYSVKAEADGFFPDIQSVTIAPGKDVPYVAALKPMVLTPESPTPAKVFENGKAWSFSDPNGWWTYAQKGVSFTKRDEGTLTFTLAKDSKPFLKEKIKKYEFVADYKDEQNKIQYTLDSHHLTKKIYADGKELKDDRNEVPINAADSYKLVVQIAPDTITVRVNGASDSTKRPETHGKFGFVNEVVLTPR